MCELSSYYRSMVDLYRHFYDKRTAFLTAYVTGISLTSVAIFEYPDIPALCIILIFISHLALFLDLYLHKRVMISGSILRDLESKFNYQFDESLNTFDTKSVSKNTIGIMSQVCSVRWDSSFTGRTGGRYFWTYGSGTIVVSLAVYVLFLSRLATNISAMNYLHTIFFTAFLIIYLIVLYRVILKAKGYEYILKSLPNYHESEELYDKYRAKLNLRNRHTYYEKSHFGESGEWLDKPTDRYRETIQEVLKGYNDGTFDIQNDSINEKIKVQLDLKDRERLDIYFWWNAIGCFSIALLLVPSIIFFG